MNLDDVEAQPFAESPNGAGAVDQANRADALGLHWRFEILERKYKVAHTVAQYDISLSALRLHKTFQRNDLRHTTFLELPWRLP